ncbi:hypothetical protein Hanom_Chr07g00639031 [Helianthus anomalus]
MVVCGFASALQQPYSTVTTSTTAGANFGFTLTCVRRQPTSGRRQPNNLSLSFFFFQRMISQSPLWRYTISGTQFRALNYT